MAITINGSGTIGGVSVGGLPDGVVDTDVLANDAVTAAKIGSLPAGSVLQVVQFKYSTEVSYSSQSITATNYSQAITPSSTSNNILVMFNCPIRKNNTGTDGIAVDLYRNGSSIGVLAYWFLYPNNGVQQWGQFSSAYLDSPSSTSAVTYQIRVRTYGGGAFLFNDNSAVGTLTLMEVAA